METIKNLELKVKALKKKEKEARIDLTFDKNYSGELPHLIKRKRKELEKKYVQALKSKLEESKNLLAYVLKEMEKLKGLEIKE